MKRTLVSTVAILMTASAAFAAPVTLKFYHWFGGDVMSTVQKVNELFMQENPNIKVQFETAPTDQYLNVIKVKLAAGDAPDLFGVFPGTEVKDYARAGYLMDLTDEPYVKDITEGALAVTRGDNGRVYTIPFDQNVIGVIYSKKIFRDLKIEVPTNWTDFLAACGKIKKAGKFPIALGAKDAWVAQLIPYALAPSMIYAKAPDFDTQMYKGVKKFNGPEWTAVMKRYAELNNKGYFHPGVLGTNYDQSAQLIATGRAAMTVNGNWILASIHAASPDIELGMFPLPAVDKGETIWFPAAVGVTTGISAKTRYPREAKLYLAFWMRPEIQKLYLNDKKAFPVTRNLQVSFDPAAEEMSSTLSTAKTVPFLDQFWPKGPQDVLQKGCQELLLKKSIPEILAAIDREWEKRTRQ